MKSNDQYLTTSDCCPNCNGSNVEGEGVDIHKNRAIQSVTCLDCFAEWVDTYFLSHFTLIKEPEDNQQ